jgi:hypothetical protein
LSAEDIAADLPVTQNELAIGGERGALLRRMTARLEFGQPIRLAGGGVY